MNRPVYREVPIDTAPECYLTWFAVSVWLRDENAYVERVVGNRLVVRDVGPLPLRWNEETGELEHPGCREVFVYVVARDGDCVPLPEEAGAHLGGFTDRCGLRWLVFLERQEPAAATARPGAGSRAPAPPRPPRRSGDRTGGDRASRASRPPPQTGRSFSAAGGGGAGSAERRGGGPSQEKGPPGTNRAGHAQRAPQSNQCSPAAGSVKEAERIQDGR